MGGTLALWLVLPLDYSLSDPDQALSISQSCGNLHLGWSALGCYAETTAKITNYVHLSYKKIHHSAKVKIPHLTVLNLRVNFPPLCTMGE